MLRERYSLERERGGGGETDGRKSDFKLHPIGKKHYLVFFQIFNLVMIAFVILD
jgi:hypothetical protein